MNKKAVTSLFFLISILLAACSGQPTPVPTAVLTPVPKTPTPVLVTPQATAQPTLTLQPTLTHTVQPTSGVLPATPILPAPTSATGGTPDISAKYYMDDRSTPAALMLSYFNAINRHEYLRAYSYYSGSPSVGDFEPFAKGYADTQSVTVAIGSYSSDGAAGSIYYTLPMVLNAVTTAGVQQKYAACYIIRLPQPGNYGAPPITPMHIDRATAKTAAPDAQNAVVISTACPSPDFELGPNVKGPSIESIQDLSSANYIDNRSGAVEVISSLFNAINRQEYVRAYSYWQNPSTSTGDYAAFAAGYADTASVTAQFGAVTSDAGAGQIYYQAPVAIQSSLKSGVQQTFVGCYTLHISQPSVQATPPFAPLGITAGKFKQVANGADVTPLLATACAG